MICKGQPNYVLYGIYNRVQQDLLRNSLPRHHPVHVARNLVDIDNCQVARVGIGGDFLLECGAKRLPEHKGQGSQHGYQRQSLEAFTAVPGTDEPVQGRQRRQPAGHGIIRATAGMDGEMAFSVLQAHQRFTDGLAHLLGGQVADDKEPGRVRVPAHAFAWKTLRQDVDGGMFDGVIAPGGQDVGSLQDVEICHF